MTVEKAARADIDALERLYDDCTDFLERHINYPGWKKGVYPVRETAEAGVEEESLFVVRAGEGLAGAMILRHEPEAGYAQADWRVELDYQDILVVYTLAVHPSFHRQGVGAALMDFVLEYGRKQGMKAVRLDVYEKNTPAIALYEKFGFQYIDTVDLGYSSYGLDRFKLFQRLIQRGAESGHAG